MSSSSAGRRRATDRHYSAEDQALDQISKEAEERLQAKRQARAEAREFRMREIERQQKEEEEKQKSQQQGAIDTPKIGSYSGSRRGSDESSGSEVSSTLSQDPKDYIRELKSQLRELEEKYKHAMVTNAQLDNTKTTHVFQIELLKEKLEEQDETMIEVQREYKEKSREYELLKRDFKNLQNDCDSLKQQSEIKDRLLQESGLVIISSEEGQLSLSKCSDLSDISIASSGTALISQESAEVLQKAGEGSLGPSGGVENRGRRLGFSTLRGTYSAIGFQHLPRDLANDDKIKNLIEERKKLQEEIKTLTDALEEEKTKEKPAANKAPQMNGPEMQLYEVQREASKQIHEYKLKLQKAEQEIANLDGTVVRLETQIKRFKYDADEAEKLEDELKTDRRRLQRELRECQNQIEELSNQNKHLNKRLEKIRQSRSALGVQ